MSQRTAIRPRAAWARSLLGFGLLLALLCGCGGGSAGAARTIAQQQQVDEVTIGIEAPERAQLLTEQDVLVTLRDARGPIDGAEVWLGLIMPTMQMSPNEPDAAAEGQGRYRAKAIFTMSGTWNLEVHATIHGQEYVAHFRAQTM
jgi:hypothetical protein